MTAQAEAAQLEQALACLDSTLEADCPEVREAWTFVKEELDARLTSAQAFFFVADYMERYQFTGRWRSNPYDYFIAWIRQQGKDRSGHAT